MVMGDGLYWVEGRLAFGLPTVTSTVAMNRWGPFHAAHGDLLHLLSSTLLALVNPRNENGKYTYRLSTAISSITSSHFLIRDIMVGF